MHIFFSVGEPSGDLHGANLIRELQQRSPGVRATGLGGPRMAAAGCDLMQDMTEFAVMGLLPVLAKLPQFLALRKRAIAELKQQRPNAVVLIDYPGFNWHIAKAAKKLGIPVYYYGLPQIWAWATWRVKKVRDFVDHALCKLPFEVEWLKQRGCHATYVGHPYFDELRNQKLDASFLAEQTRQPGRLVTLLPGSRSQEVKSNLPTLLKAAELVRRQSPDARFAIASYNERQAVVARAQAEVLQKQVGLKIETYVGRTPELIEQAVCCLACSGSVSLELLYRAKPSAVVYKTSWLLYTLLCKSLMNVKYITLVNLLAADNIFDGERQPYNRNRPGHEQVLFPEYPTYEDRSAELASHAIEWLQDEPSRQRLIAKLETLRDTLHAGGASATAADYIVSTLNTTGPLQVAAAPRPASLGCLTEPACG